MKQILVVDDEPAIRDTLKDLFEDEGFAVDVAEDGAQALATLNERGPHNLVVFDLFMPNVDGHELYQTLRAEPRFANMPLIISTAHPSEAPPGVLVMRKPVDVNVLLNAVKRLCG
jgi:CheY-like chemotaxis protein